MSGLRRFTAAAVIISLFGASTSAIAASSAPARAPAVTAAGSWGTLSAMTGSTATAAAMQNDCDDCAGGFWAGSPFALGVILATLAAAIYIITQGDDDDKINFSRPPRSPF